MWAYFQETTAPYFLFPGVAGLQTAPTGNFSPAKQSRAFKHAHRLTNLQSSLLRNAKLPSVAAMKAGNGGPRWQDGLFLSPFTPNDRNGPPSASQDLSTIWNQDMAMLFGCTHPPPLSHPICMLLQNLSPKDIAGSDIMNLKVSQSLPNGNRVKNRLTGYPGMCHSSTRPPNIHLRWVLLEFIIRCQRCPHLIGLQCEHWCILKVLEETCESLCLEGISRDSYFY